jgi:ligand-binding sensor domain-containing protein
VTLTGVPTGSTASVAINGPASFTKTISATTTVSDLAAGSYTISAPPIRVPGTQVDSVYDATVTGSPANVALGATSMSTVSYAQRAGSGMMWVTNFSTHNAYGFDATTIAKTGTHDDAPAVSLNVLNVGTNGPPTYALAFSATGDMWLGSCKNNQTGQVLAKFAPGKISASGSPTPSVTVSLPTTDTSYDCASALAFDSAGNLWVGMYHGHILKYNAADLVATGAPAPAINLTSAAYFNEIFDLAFDGSGNLFTATYQSPIVARLSAAQLTATAANIVPDVVFQFAASAGLGGIAVAKDGSLWVSNYNNSSIYKLKASALGTSASPPVPDLTVTATGVDGPELMAFDNAGNLWVASLNNNEVVALTSADLATSGVKTPLTTLNTGGTVLNAPLSVRFNPAAQ